MAPPKNSLVVLRNGRLAVWGQAVRVNGVIMTETFYAFDLVTNQPISANRHDVAAVVGLGNWGADTVIDAPRDHYAGLFSPEGLAQRSGLGAYEPCLTTRYDNLYVLYEEQPEGPARWWAYDGQPFNATGPLELWPIIRIAGGLQPDGPG